MSNSTTLTEREARELAVELSRGAFRPRSAIRFDGNQRHESWKVTTESASAWLKIDHHGVAVAGVKREAEVLVFLSRQFLSPKLIAWRRTLPLALMTEHVAGQSIEQIEDQNLLAALPALVDWLDHFSRRAQLPSLPTGSVGAGGLFSSHPDIAKLLNESEAVVPFGLFRRLNYVHRRTGRVGSVHGSFDPSNILVRADGSIAGVLDFEAARPGPAAIDVAGFGLDLLLLGKDLMARTWLQLWIQRCPYDALPVAGHLALRLAYREGSKDPPTDTASRSARAIIEALSDLGSGLAP